MIASSWIFPQQIEGLGIRHRALLLSATKRALAPRDHHVRTERVPPGAELNIMLRGITVHHLQPIHFIDPLKHGLSLTSKGRKDFALELGRSPCQWRCSDGRLALWKLLGCEDHPS